jgi:hypothetical protein
MGDHSIPDRAISIDLILELHRRLKRELEVAVEERDLKTIEEVVMLGAFSTMGYCGGLRGEEIVLGDLGGMNDHWEEAVNDKTPHVPMALLGHFQGETGEQYHFIPLAPVTTLGIEVEYWMSAVRRWYKAKGIVKGPIFRNPKGKRVRAGYWAQSMLARFQMIQLSRPDLIPEIVKVTEEYGMSRFWRRGSNSQSLAQGVSEHAINRNDRWRKKERAKGKTASLAMIEHYADVRLIVKRLLVYSAAL